MSRRSITKKLSFLFWAATLGAVWLRAEDASQAASDLPFDAMTEHSDCPKACGKSGLESQAVSFEGASMVLEGPLSFENEWGSIRADRAVLPKRSGKKICFSKVDLEGDVVLKFKKEGELRSGRATFDKELGTAVFTAPQGDDSWVVYKTEVKAEGGKKREFLEVRAKRVAAAEEAGEGISRAESPAAKLRVEAEGDVAIRLGGLLLQPAARL